MVEAWKRLPHRGRRESMFDPEGGLRHFGGFWGGGDPTPLRRDGGGFVDPKQAPFS